MSDTKIGRRIKTISVVLWWINVAIVIIAFVAVAATARYWVYSKEEIVLVIVGSAVLGILEVFFAYFYFLLIRGFGHLVETTTVLTQRTKSIEKQIDCLQKHECYMDSQTPAKKVIVEQKEANKQETAQNSAPEVDATPEI